MFPFRSITYIARSGPATLCPLHQPEAGCKEEERELETDDVSQRLQRPINYLPFFLVPSSRDGRHGGLDHVTRPE